MCDPDTLRVSSFTHTSPPSPSAASSACAGANGVVTNDRPSTRSIARSSRSTIARYPSSPIPSSTAAAPEYSKCLNLTNGRSPRSPGPEGHVPASARSLGATT